MKARSRRSEADKTQAMPTPRPASRGRLWTALAAGLLLLGLDHFVVHPRLMMAEEDRARAEHQVLKAERAKDRNEALRAELAAAEEAHKKAAMQRNLLQAAGLAATVWLLAAAWLSRALLLMLLMPILKFLWFFPRLALRFLAAFMGEAALKDGPEGWAVDRPRLRLHFWRTFWLGAALLSFGGLFLARVPLFQSGAYFWPLAFAAGALLSLCVYLAHEWGKPESRIRMANAPRLFAPLLGSALALLAGAYLAGVCWDLAGRVALSRAKAAFDREGYSLALPEEEPQVKDEDNAAIPYRKAVHEEWALTTTAKSYNVNSMEMEALNRLISLASRQEPFGKAGADAAAALKRHGKTLAHAREASTRKAFAWGIKLQRPYYHTELPPYNPGLACVRLLAADAILAAEAGRMAEALKSLDQGFRFTQALHDGRTLIGQMVAIAQYAMLFKASAYVLNRPGTRTDARPWEAVRDGSLAMGVKRLVNLEASTQWDHAQFLGDHLYSLKPLPEGYDMNLLRPYAAFIRLDAASSRPLWSRILGAMDASEPPKDAPDMEAEAGKAWMLSAMSLPRFNDLYKKGLRADAWFRLADAAARARAFKARKGRWPDAAWELSDGKLKDSAKLRDPFSGGWLKIRPHQGGILIYSVGMDGIDDQGAPQDLTEGTEKGDIAWILK